MVSDNPQAHAIVRAHRAGIPTVVIDPKGYSSRETFDRAVSAVLERSKVKLIVLAGFMRILTPWFVRRYEGKIINIHPALLPAFPGSRAVRDALGARVKVTGVTVHLVDEKVDHGLVLAQVKVNIRRGDTEKALHARIHRAEHRLYPKVIGAYLKKVNKK